MTSLQTAAYWIDHLQLTAHVEGGAFREIYRSPLLLPQQTIGTAFRNSRPASTSIYFLLQEGQFSAFHRIVSDEIWHHYTGDCLEIFELLPNGQLTTHLLGKDPEAGEQFQVKITAGNWFASRVKAGGNYTLCGCTVAPGFDFEDFELASRSQLCAAYPAHAALITSLTYTDQR